MAMLLFNIWAVNTMKIAHCVFFAKVGSKYCEVLIKPSKMLKTVKIMTKWQKFAQTDHKVHRKNLLRKGESVSQGPFLSHPPVYQPLPTTIASDKSEQLGADVVSKFWHE